MLVAGAGGLHPGPSIAACMSALLCVGCCFPRHVHYAATGWRSVVAPLCNGHGRQPCRAPTRPGHYRPWPLRPSRRPQPHATGSSCRSGRRVDLWTSGASATGRTNPSRSRRPSGSPPQVSRRPTPRHLCHSPSTRPLLPCVSRLESSGLLCCGG